MRVFLLGKKECLLGGNFAYDADFAKIYQFK
jgi:hypothetical protein